MRDQYIEGVGPWHWPSRDSGAWGAPGDGPNHEFPQIRDLLIRSVKKAGTIVQAGGCCGMYPRLFSECFENVWTFEPCPLNFHHLVLNCQRDSIRKFQAVLSDRRGTLGLVRVDPVNVGMHHVAADGEERPVLPVQSMMIDDLELTECDAIQLDVEGTEEFAIKGGIKTIEKFLPAISLETVSGWTREYLTRLGYQVVATVSPDTVWKVD